MKKYLIAALLSLLFVTGNTEVRLPKLFGDNMVLQRDQRLPVWGWASAGERITIRFNKQVVTLRADKEGNWKTALLPEKAGGPFQLVVKGKNSITINNVLVGDVWVCSGQSNMEWQLVNTDAAAAEISQANYPMIRHFQVPKTVASQPLSDLSGGNWQVCTPLTAGSFTAIGYFFGKQLHKELKVPIGLLNTSWGGTHVETWTSRGAFENSDEFKTMIANMPRLNLDSISRQLLAQTTSRVKQLQPVFPLDSKQIESWPSPQYDDTQWPVVKVPGLWEKQAPGELDGIVWLRKTIVLPAASAGKAAVLTLAMIDDEDECYVNGTKVGGTRGYNAKRKYTVAPGILKAGKNVIAVRVNDTGGGGGIYGEAEEVKLVIGEEAISLAGDWRFQVASLSATTTTLGPNSYPTLLYNGMVYPLIPFAMKGVIWYQGESNTGRSIQYQKAFPLMINDWRKQWAQGDFPFYFVQLASFNANNGDSRKGSGWAELREAQTLTLSLPYTGMAVTTDIGNPTDIHPRNKLDVGKRLAAIALNKTYGKGNVYSGPMYQSHQQEGNKIVVTFKETGSGLVTPDKYGYLKGFEIAGEDQRFFYAKALLQGDRVVVFNEPVEHPAAVRFGWADDASDNNLFNKEGFPAVPFRTDQWKAITDGGKFTIGK